MGMTALITAGSKPHVPTRAAWYSITTNSLRDPFYRQGAFVKGVFGSILKPGFLPEDQVPRAPIAEHEGEALLILGGGLLTEQL